MKVVRAKGNGSTRVKVRANPVITRVTQAAVYAHYTYFGVVKVLSRVRTVTLFAGKEGQPPRHIHPFLTV